jgi:hypothetical protein
MEKSIRKDCTSIGDIMRNGLLSIQREIAESDWTVERDGTMVHKSTGYYIEATRLGENWLEHMAAKTWVNMKTFVKAYIRACYIAGVKTVRITY